MLVKVAKWRILSGVVHKSMRKTDLLERRHPETFTKLPYFYAWARKRLRREVRRAWDAAGGR
jgi:hypothetical protein